jgi:hypothetical protein
MVINGIFISKWENGDVETKATLDTETSELTTQSVDVGEEYEHLIEETFVSLGGEDYKVCPECHEYVTKTVMVNGIGNTLEEQQECPNCGLV